jgi:RNA polymerase sigma-70 factor (ECF subfamily)
VALDEWRMGRVEDFEGVLEGAQRGDRCAAEELFPADHPMLLRYLRSQERRVAEDLAGEVWLAAAAALHDFRGDERGYRSWLFTAARRRVVERRRRGVRRRTDVVDPAVFLESRASDDPAQDVIASLGATAAVGLISQLLSADQAEVLILRTVADFSAGEGAVLMERPESWVRVTQHRAMKHLASHLDDRIDVTSDPGCSGPRTPCSDARGNPAPGADGAVRSGEPVAPVT